MCKDDSMFFPILAILGSLTMCLCIYIGHSERKLQLLIELEKIKQVNSDPTCKCGKPAMHIINDDEKYCWDCSPHKRNKDENNRN